MNINYKSDFALTLTFEGELPQSQWRARFRTRTESTTMPASAGYTVGYDGTEYMRCRVNPEAENEIIVELCDHDLVPGELYFEWCEMVQNDLFAKQQQRVVRPTITQITLIDGVGDEASGISIESAYIKIF